METEKNPNAASRRRRRCSAFVNAFCFKALVPTKTRLLSVVGGCDTLQSHKLARVEDARDDGKCVRLSSGGARAEKIRKKNRNGFFFPYFPMVSEECFAENQAAENEKKKTTSFLLPVLLLSLNTYTIKFISFLRTSHVIIDSPLQQNTQTT